MAARRSPVYLVSELIVESTYRRRALPMALLELPSEILLEIGDILTPVGRFFFSQTCSTLYGLIKVPKKRAIAVSALKEGSIPVLDHLLELGMKCSPSDFSHYLSVEKHENIEWMRTHLTEPLTNIQKHSLAKRLTRDSPDLECVKYGLSLCDSDRPFTFCTALVYCNPDHQMFDKAGLNLFRVIKAATPSTVGLFGDLRLLQLRQENKPFSVNGCVQCATHIITRPSEYYPMLDYLFDRKDLDMNKSDFLLKTAITSIRLEGVDYCLKKKIPFTPDFLLRCFLAIRYVNIDRVIPLTKLLLTHGLELPKNLFKIGPWKKCIRPGNVRFLISKGVVTTNLQLEEAL